MQKSMITGNGKVTSRELLPGFAYHGLENFILGLHTLVTIAHSGYKSFFLVGLLLHRSWTFSSVWLNGKDKKYGAKLCCKEKVEEDDIDIFPGTLARVFQRGEVNMGK